MKRKTLALIGLALAILSAVVICTAGRVLTIRFEARDGSGTAGAKVAVEKPEIADIVDREDVDGALRLKLRAGSGRGSTHIRVEFPDGSVTEDVVYAHTFGVLTRNSFFGDSAGSRVLPVCAAVWLALALWSLARRLRQDLKSTPYRYANAVRLGIAAFLGITIVDIAAMLPQYRGLDSAVSQVMSVTGFFSMVTLPAALAVSVLVCVECVRLMRREGRSWRNLLGVILALLLCAGIVGPFAFSEWSQRTTVIDAHNMNGATLYVVKAIESCVAAIVAYLECVLIGTIAVSVRAARGVPDFDRTHILILGCQTRADGTLTPLLRGRADRALEFGRLQREHGGADVIFVPSGGKGADEPLAEGDAIANYLREQGIGDERILVERESANTDENVRFSMERIRESGADAPRVAFSTTNYHVFRAGNIALTQGVNAQGIGSKTKRYFWINAFVREFIATLKTYAKTHAIICVSLVAVMILMTLALRVSFTS